MSSLKNVSELIVKPAINGGMGYVVSRYILGNTEPIVLKGYSMNHSLLFGTAMATSSLVADFVEEFIPVETKSGEILKIIINSSLSGVVMVVIGYFISGKFILQNFALGASISAVSSFIAPSVTNLLK